MTQPVGAPNGYTQRPYEAEVYARVARANANKVPAWDPDWHDPAKVAGRYSKKSAELYERKLAAEGGEYRPGLPASDVDYRGMPHERLRAMVRDGANAPEVDEQGQVINDLGNLLKELSSAIRQAVSKEQAGWQGDGAEAVFQGLTGLSKWMDILGDAALLMANRFSQTSAAILNAQNNMPEPAGRTVMQSLDLVRQQLANGDLLGAMKTYRDMPAEANAAFQAQQQAAQVLAARDQVLYNVCSTQPMFTPPPQPITPTAPPADSPRGSVGVSSAAMPDAGRTTAASSFPTSATAGDGAPTLPVVGSASRPPVRPHGDVTPEADPLDRFRRPAGAGRMSGWSRTPGSTPGPGPEVGLLPNGRGTGMGGGIERGISSRSGSLPGSSGRPDGRAPGSGATARGPGAGRKSGTAQPGAKAAEAPAARTGPAGTAGKSRASGMPGVVGSGKKSEEDKEHKRSVVFVEHDPAAALDLKVSTDEHGNKIAPPVIGE